MLTAFVRWPTGKVTEVLFHHLEEVMPWARLVKADTVTVCEHIAPSSISDPEDQQTLVVVEQYTQVDLMGALPDEAPSEKKKRTR